MTPTFQSIGLNSTTLAALAERGFTAPTAIQAQAIPALLQGEDVVGQAQTGTGKTLAYGLPLIEATRGKGLQALVLAPTRELANQISKELNASGAGTPFHAIPVYGGVGFGRQTRALQSGDATCVVACPGRLLDLMGRGLIDLSAVRQLVLDEADRMLDMGFVRDIDRIVKGLPRKRQTILMSATVPPAVKRLAEDYMRAPTFLRAEEGPTATELTDQFRVDVRSHEKLPTLLALLERERPEMSLIFTKTKRGAKRLAKRLNGLGHSADALQGNLSQNARDRVMRGFRDGKFDHLVATNVASRGLDVKGITHVVNYDFPMVNEDYVHRIGRTGRAGERGRAFLFVDRGEERDARAVERLSGVPLEAYDVGPLKAVPGGQPRHGNGGGGNGRGAPKGHRGKGKGRRKGKRGGGGGRRHGRSGKRGHRGNRQRN